MVRAVLFMCMFLGSALEWESEAFGESSRIPNSELALTSPSLCEDSGLNLTNSSLMTFGGGSNCRSGEEDELASTILFSSRQDPFNLQTASNIPSLAKQGGSRIVQASNDIPLMARHLSAGLHMAYRDPFLRSENSPSATNRMGAQFVLKGD